MTESLAFETLVKSSETANEILDILPDTDLIFLLREVLVNQYTILLSFQESGELYKQDLELFQNHCDEITNQILEIKNAISQRKK